MSDSTTNSQEPTSVERKHPQARCENCSLYNDPDATYAGGHGPDKADVVLVGEAPGYQEARTGRPFVGASGKLLDTVLAHHGIDRRKVFIDNVVACRPPDNSTPSANNVRCCWPRAKHEIEQRGAGTIVALGATASSAVLQSTEGITRLRVGPPRESTIFPGTRVVATVHPAFCLRQGDQFPHFVNDIGKIYGVQKPWTPPTFRVFDDWEEAVQVLEELQDKCTEIVVDIECGIEKDAAFDHPDHYKMLCIGFAYAPNKAIVIGEEALQHSSVRFQLRVLFGDETKKWIAHNGKFDLAALQSWGMGNNLYFDTMLASYALDERPGTNGLKYNAVEELGAPTYDDDIKQYLGKDKNFSSVPRDILYKYNAYDVACTWALYEHYVTQLEEEGLRVLHDFMCTASMMLMHAEMSGVGIDEEYLRELEVEYTDAIEKSVAYLNTWVLNPNSPKQVTESLESLGVKVNSTNIEVLETLEQRYSSDTEVGQFVRGMIKHRKLAKFYGTYVKGIRKRLRQSKIHTSFLVHGTTTGRLSSRNPNLQNVPRGDKIRKLFVPAAGNVFIQVDYSQVELRVAAVLAKDDWLIEVFNDESRDLFNELGATIHGGLPDDPTERKELRIKTKAYVYGINYGRSAYDIAKEFGISQSEAQKGIDTYLGLAAGLAKWRKTTMDKILDNSNDNLTTVFGRQRRFWLITRQNQNDCLKEGLAFVPQSTASDINLMAATRLHLVHGLDVRILVHDSTLIECREGEAQAQAELMQEVMTATASECMGDLVPFPTEASIGYSWGAV